MVLGLKPDGVSDFAPGLDMLWEASVNQAPSYLMSRYVVILQHSSMGAGGPLMPQALYLGIGISILLLRRYLR